MVYLCLKKKKQRHLHRFHNNTNLNISIGQQWSSTRYFKEVLTEGKFIPSHVTTIISGADMNTEQKISDTCSINYLNITFQTRCKNNMKSTNVHAGCREVTGGLCNIASCINNEDGVSWTKEKFHRC